MTVHLHVGGVVAMGFDPTGKFLLVVSHSGRGLYKVGSWERVCRDSTQVYPENNQLTGIGPTQGIAILVSEKDYATDKLAIKSSDGSYWLTYEEGVISIAKKAD